MDKDIKYVREWFDNNEHDAKKLVKTWLQAHPQILQEITHNHDRTTVPFSLDNQLLCPRVSSGNVTGRMLNRHLSTPNVSNRKTVAELGRLNKHQLFMELLRDVVSPDFDVNSIGHKILVNMLLLSNADRSSLFLVEGSEEKKILVSRLFDVTVNSHVESALHDEAEAIKIPIGVGIVGTVAETMKKINLEDAYKVDMQSYIDYSPINSFCFIAG